MATHSLLAKLDPAAESQMRDLIGGALRTQAIYVVAKLGVPDQLALGPRAAEDLAERLQVHAATLLRVLRFLVVSRVFVQNEDGRFALAPAGQLLQTAHPRSLRPSAIRAGEGMWNVTSRLLDAVQTGRTPHDDVHGKSFFERTDDRAFGSRMNASTAGLGAAIARLECVQRARTIVDVGGGHGAMLIELLRAHPSARGVLFDREATIEGARPLIKAAGLADRCDVIAGDFFESVPKGGDVYLLSWVLHDWDDARAARILRSCRDAASDATLVIVEVLLPARATMHEAAAPGVIADPYALDLQMLLLTGGRERTVTEYSGLLEGAGYRIREMSEPASARGASIIEARAQGG
ncbi:MAG TPA: methyltransferase [Thermoanaerobaculia bacterium]|nr:methyltransferase [Thermoanaerobaculia bacterium]